MDSFNRSGRNELVRCKTEFFAGILSGVFTVPNWDEVQSVGSNSCWYSVLRIAHEKAHRVTEVVVNANTILPEVRR